MVLCFLNQPLLKEIGGYNQVDQASQVRKTDTACFKRHCMVFLV